MPLRLRQPGHRPLRSPPCKDADIESRPAALTVAWVVLPPWLLAKRMGSRTPLVTDVTLGKIANVCNLGSIGEATNKLRGTGLFSSKGTWVSDPLNSLHLLMSSLEVNGSTAIKDWDSAKVTEVILALLHQETPPWKTAVGFGQFLTHLQTAFKLCGRSCLSGCCSAKHINSAATPQVSALNPV